MFVCLCVVWVEAQEQNVSLARSVAQVKTTSCSLLGSSLSPSAGPPGGAVLRHACPEEIKVPLCFRLESVPALWR